MIFIYHSLIWNKNMLLHLSYSCSKKEWLHWWIRVEFRCLYAKVTVIWNSWGWLSWICYIGEQFSCKPKYLHQSYNLPALEFWVCLPLCSISSCQLHSAYHQSPGWPWITLAGPPQCPQSENEKEGLKYMLSINVRRVCSVKNTASCRFV